MRKYQHISYVDNLTNPTSAPLQEPCVTSPGTSQAKHCLTKKIVHHSNHISIKACFYSKDLVVVFTDFYYTSLLFLERPGAPCVTMSQAPLSKAGQCSLP